MSVTEREMATDETLSLISSDKVEDTAVYGAERDRIGRIEKLMIDKQSGRVAYVVMSFGGFLGVGERRHPLPWDRLRYDRELEGYVVGVSKQQLEEAPSYPAADEPDWLDPRFRRGVDAYWINREMGVPLA